MNDWVKAILDGTPKKRGRVDFDGRICRIEGQIVVYRTPIPFKTFTAKGICLHSAGEIYMSKRLAYPHIDCITLKHILEEEMKKQGKKVFRVAERHMKTADTEFM